MAGMAGQPYIISEEWGAELRQMLDALKREARARLTLLIDKAGQTLESAGETGELDLTSLSSLIAGNVAATSGIARLVGEADFPTLSHEGERESIFIVIIERALLVVLFDDGSNLGLVKLRARRAGVEISRMLAEIERDAAGKGQADFLRDVTDEDIDSLFN